MPVTWAPITDVSEHQGAIDFAKMRSRGVVGVIIRATNGTRVDRRVDEHYAGALAGGFQPHQIGFYSFLNPKRGGATYTAEVTAQVIRGITGRTDVLYMLDVESYRREHPNPGSITIAGAEWAAYVRRHRDAFVSVMPGARAIGYTNQAYWNGSEGPRDDELARELDWIVPRYPVHSVAAYEREGRPGDPATWSEWAFAQAPGPFPPRGARGWQGWQFSADFNRQGPRYGCESADLDLNIVDAAAWQRWTTPTEDDMTPLAVPRRVYDSRAEGAKVAAGQTIVVDIGARAAFVHVTAAASDGDGWLSISGTDQVSPASIVNFDADRVESDGAPIALPDGKLRVTAHRSASHVVVDVFAESA